VAGPEPRAALLCSCDSLVREDDDRTALALELTPLPNITLETARNARPPKYPLPAGKRPVRRDARPPRVDVRVENIGSSIPSAALRRLPALSSRGPLLTPAAARGPRTAHAEARRRLEGRELRLHGPSQEGAGVPSRGPVGSQRGHRSEKAKCLTSI
jgi:hypothetical protein